MDESAAGRGGFRSMLEAERMASRWRGVRLHLPAGQFLVYAGHVPSGVHVLIGGALEASSDGGRDVARWDAAAGALVIPLRSRLHEPFSWTLRILGAAELIYFSREAVESDPELALALEQLALMRVPPSAS